MLLVKTILHDMLLIPKSLIDQVRYLSGAHDLPGVAFQTCRSQESITASHQKELWRREAGPNAKHDSLAWDHGRAFPVSDPCMLAVL